ncbi:MAG: hypothetical protein P1U61_00110 [Legionellaceae bacterium]|nr:hypothetical protein [Legionellaceae bacterium]
MSSNKVEPTVWVQKQATPMLRQIASKIEDHMDGISFETYLMQLNHMMDDFFEKIGQQPYMIILPEHDDRDGRAHFELYKTVEYIIDDKQQRKPDCIVDSFAFYQALRNKPNIQYVLLIDIAAFYQTEAEYLLKNIFSSPLPRKNFKLHLGVVYLAKSAEDFLLKQTLCQESEVLAHGQLLSLESCLDASEKDYIKKLDLKCFSPRLTRSYFHVGKLDAPFQFEPFFRQSSLLQGLYAELEFERFLEQRKLPTDVALSEKDGALFDNFVLKIPSQENAKKLLSRQSFFDLELEQAKSARSRALETAVDKADEPELGDDSENLGGISFPHGIPLCTIM